MLHATQRASVGTQTHDSHFGGEVRFFLGGFAWELGVIGAATFITCLLNGLCLQTYWRPSFMSRPRAAPMEAGHLSSHSAAFSSSVAPAPARVPSPPAAYYGLYAALAFEWVVTQYVLQLAVRGFTKPALPRERSRTTQVCGLWYGVSSIPFLVCHLALYGAELYPAGSAELAPRWRPPHQGLFVVTMTVDLLALALIASYVWCDAVVSWMEARVCEEARRLRQQRQSAKVEH